MMNPQIRDQWVANLNSGEYEQGKGSLTRISPDGTEKNCCLGVLCEMAVKAGIVYRTNTSAGGTVSYGTDYIDESDGYPPQAVVEWAGLDSFSPTLTVDGVQQNASNLNDRTDNLTFPQIAALIADQL